MSHGAADNGPDQPTPLVVDIDNQLARHDPIPESHDARAFFQTNVGDEPRR